jgi:hypothetical protein
MYCSSGENESNRIEDLAGIYASAPSAYERPILPAINIYIQPLQSIYYCVRISTGKSFRENLPAFQVR